LFSRRQLFYLYRKKLKKLFLVSLFAPVFCYGQNDCCKKIKKKIEVAKNVTAFESPDLDHLSVIKQCGISTFFALHIHCKDDIGHFESTGISIEFEDGTILKDESVSIDCKQEMSVLASGSDSHGSASYAGKYLLQAFFPITTDNIGLFISKKIMSVSLENCSVKIHNKEATKIMNYVACLKDMKP
jgi:hypothetical protein